MKWSNFVYYSIIFVFASALIIPTSHAKENSLKKGRWALQFEIDRDFDLSGFQGQTLSVKKHTSDNRAYRLGLTVLLDASDGESTTIFDDTLQWPGSNERNSKRFDKNLQKIYYNDISAPVNLFYGFGATTSLSHTESEEHYGYSIDTVTYDNYYKSVFDSWSVGVSGVFGAEWFFAKNMSLLGEYASSVTYGGNTRKDESRRYLNGSTVDSRNSKEENDTVRFGSSKVKFGLSVYF